MTDYERETPETESKPTTDEAIIAALDGYANDGEIWISARKQFTEAIREGATLDSALDLALKHASEGSECEPSVAADRFWERLGTHEIGETYADDIAEFSAKINTLIELRLPTTHLSNDKEHNITNESTMVGIDSKLPPVTVIRLTNDETGEVSYRVNDLSAVLDGDKRSRVYSWSNGSDTISAHTYGPGEPRDFILDVYSVRQKLGLAMYETDNMISEGIEAQSAKTKGSKISEKLSSAAKRLMGKIVSS